MMVAAVEHGTGLLLGALSPFRRSSPSAPPASGSGMFARLVYRLRARASGRALRADSGRDYPSKERCVTLGLAEPVWLAGLLFAATCLIAPTPAIAESETPATPLTMSVLAAAAREGRAVGFVVTLSGQFPQPVSQPVKVEYATSSGTAASGTDFLATSGTLVFWHGGKRTHDHSQIVRVPTIHDEVEFKISLSAPTGRTVYLDV